MDRYLRSNEDDLERIELLEKELNTLKSKQRPDNCCKGCDGTGNINANFKRHLSLKNCPIYNARKRINLKNIRPIRINYLKGILHNQSNLNLHQKNRQNFFKEKV
jgi:hypothetical protein